MADRVTLRVSAHYHANIDDHAVYIMATWPDEPLQRHVAFRADKDGAAPAADVVTALRLLAKAIEDHKPQA